MRSFIRTRYGCDFCKKVGGSKHHMQKHEAGCTNNPNRHCKLHVIATGDDFGPTVAELRTALAEGGYPMLVSVSGGCPACKLAALRQSWVKPADGEPWPEEPQDGREKFDFKAELASVWSEHNSREREDGPSYYGGDY
ncbi:MULTISPECIES: hypothetical protein [unclassified Stenotrophomonas]|uniref:hypothetical protein n=1 Tax=unclassified Stenotrophomonas TaxID=196198 RepID=UPI003012F2D8